MWIWFVLGFVYLVAYWPVAFWLFWRIYSRAEMLGWDGELYDKAVHNVLKSNRPGSLAKEWTDGLRGGVVKVVIGYLLAIVLFLCVPIDYILWPIKLLCLRFWVVHDIDEEYNRLRLLNEKFVKDILNALLKDEAL